MVCKCGCASRTGVSNHSPNSDALFTYCSPNTISVGFGEETARLNLKHLCHARLDAREVVSLADIWICSGRSEELSDVAFDFVGEDGFRSSSEWNEVVFGTGLARGFLDCGSRDLVWDQALSLPRYFCVKRVTTFVAYAASHTGGGEGAMTVVRLDKVW